MAIMRANLPIMSSKSPFQAVSDLGFTVYTANEFVGDIHLEQGEPMRLRYFMGGSSYFIATAAKRIIKDAGAVRCLGTVSRDSLGQRFVNHLNAAGVDTSLLAHVEAESMIAHVIKEPGKENAFHFPAEINAMDAASNASPTSLRADERKIFCIGSVCAFSNKDYWLQYAHTHKDDAIVMFDMNTRPALIKDHAEHNKTLLTWAAASHIMKVSDADLIGLYGETVDFDQKIRQFQAQGAKAVILTRGEKAPILYTAQGIVNDVTVRALDCINTVGAGDNFFAGLAAGFAKKNVFTANQMESLTIKDWHDIVKTACVSSEQHLILQGATDKNAAILEKTI